MEEVFAGWATGVVLILFEISVTRLPPPSLVCRAHFVSETGKSTCDKYV